MLFRRILPASMPARMKRWVFGFNELNLSIPRLTCYSDIMPPPTGENDKTLQEIVDDVGVYHLDAYQFVQDGLSYTVTQIYGNGTDPHARGHVSGQQLCLGLRDFALQRWGLLAGTVLRRWGVTSTMDFGRIVFAMIASGQLHKTENDSVEDFRNVYDFRTAFDSTYRIEV